MYITANDGKEGVKGVRDHGKKCCPTHKREDSTVSAKCKTSKTPQKRVGVRAKITASALSRLMGQAWAGKSNKHRY